MDASYPRTMSYLAHLVVSAALLVLVANAIRGFEISGAVAALIGAFVLGIANTVVWWPAFVLTLPLTLVTFGIFLLVLNAGVLKLVAWIVPGFRIQGFAPAFWGALLLTLLNLLLESFVGGTL